MEARILIVEDDYIAQLTLDKILRDMGFRNIKQVSSILDAEEILQKEAFDIALLDVYYQGEQMGIGFAENLKKEHEEMGVFVHSALGKGEVESLLSQNDSIDGVILKPYRQESIRDLLRSWM